MILSAPLPLGPRTFLFAKNVRSFVNKIPYSRNANDDCKQVLRSSGSVGANYLEAQEAVSKKDFLLRIKISRKEARESIYWLKLLQDLIDGELQNQCTQLIQESTELVAIFTACIKTTERKMLQTANVAVSQDPQLFLSVNPQDNICVIVQVMHVCHWVTTVFFLCSDGLWMRSSQRSNIRH